MSGQVILIRYGEIALKSKYVRNMLVKALISNIKTHFSAKDLECFITSDYGRIYLYCNDLRTAGKILGRVFGIVSFSYCTETSSNLPQLREESIRLAKDWINEGMTFAVRTRRVGTHPYSSQSLASDIGALILDSGKQLRVDLDKPDVEIFIEVRHDKAYIYRDSVQGLGGFPVGTQGTITSLIEKEGDILAAWLMMKRGCRVHAAYIDEVNGLDALPMWDPRIDFHVCDDLDEFLELSNDLNAEGIALGWDLGKALSKKLKINVPVFYPLVGLSGEEKERFMRDILSYEHANNKPH